MLIIMVPMDSLKAFGPSGFDPAKKIFKIERFSANTVKNVENSVFAEI